MKISSIVFTLLSVMFLQGCVTNRLSETEINHPELKDYQFLQPMLDDDYYPEHLVRKGGAILRKLCVSIEAENPRNLNELYKLTHDATRNFNELALEFDQQGSEFETAAREITSSEFAYIARTYGFKSNTEMLIAPRQW